VAGPPFAPSRLRVRPSPLRAPRGSACDPPLRCGRSATEPLLKTARSPPANAKTDLRPKAWRGQRPATTANPTPLRPSPPHHPRPPFAPFAFYAVNPLPPVAPRRGIPRPNVRTRLDRPYRARSKWGVQPVSRGVAPGWYGFAPLGLRMPRPTLAESRSNAPRSRRCAVAPLREASPALWPVWEGRCPQRPALPNDRGHALDVRTQRTAPLPLPTFLPFAPFGASGQA
jgi:hypothetical protein